MGGAAAEAMGGSFGRGASRGATTAAIAYTANHWLHDTKQGRMLIRKAQSALSVVKTATRHIFENLPFQSREAGIAKGIVQAMEYEQTARTMADQYFEERYDMPRNERIPTAYPVDVFISKDHQMKNLVKTQNALINLYGTETTH